MRNPSEPVYGLPATFTADDRRRLVRVLLIGGRWESLTWDGRGRTRGGIVGVTLSGSLGLFLLTIAGRGLSDGATTMAVAIGFIATLLLVSAGLEALYVVRLVKILRALPRTNA